MSQAWQELFVYVILAIAAGITIYTAIDTFRAIRSGGCGGRCAGCKPASKSLPPPAEAPPINPHPPTERIVFLPTGSLRNSRRS